MASFRLPCFLPRAERPTTSAVRLNPLKIDPELQALRADAVRTVAWAPTVCWQSDAFLRQALVIAAVAILAFPTDPVQAQTGQGPLYLREIVTMPSESLALENVLPTLRANYTPEWVLRYITSGRGPVRESPAYKTRTTVGGNVFGITVLTKLTGRESEDAAARPLADKAFIVIGPDNYHGWFVYVVEGGRSDWYTLPPPPGVVAEVEKLNAYLDKN